MPALKYNNLHARGDTSGRNVSVIFAIVAFFVVAACLIWGVLLPKYRNKHSPPRPPSVLFTSPSLITVSDALTPQCFPSHPAVCRDLRKRPSGRLRQYNPRTETPFPNTPPLGDSISLPSITPRNHSAIDIAALPTSHGLFSPAKDRQPSRRGVPSKESDGQSLTTAAATGDANDYTLAVPEPCLLRARSAGRAPPLKRHLDKFPVPRSGSSYTDKLAHPNKLFRDLELRASASTGVSQSTPCPPPIVADDGGSLDGGTSSKRSDQLDSEHSSKSQAKLRGDGLRLTQEYDLEHWRQRRLARRGTWSSNTGKGHDRYNMLRSGTVARSNTPVVDARTRYEHTSKSKSSRAVMSKNGTVNLSECPTESTLSSRLGTCTPPTSPVEAPKLYALPKFGRDSLETPTPEASFIRQPPSLMALPASDRVAPMCTIQEDKKSDERRNTMFRPLVHMRPTRLNLATVTKPPSLRKKLQRHSMSSLGSMLVPLVKSKRPSIQSSSVYSRDTLGVSAVNTPLSPAFSDKTSAWVNDKVNTTHRKASSVDILRCKIDDWRLEMPEIDNFGTSPSSVFKRALSDLGPYSPTLPDSGFGSVRQHDRNANDMANPQSHADLPTICIGRASDDIFRDPLPNSQSRRVLTTLLDMETASSSMLQRGSAAHKGAAPGGAGWL